MLSALARVAQEEGEKTVVLKASSSAELEALEAKAHSLLLPTFLVRTILGTTCSSLHVLLYNLKYVGECSMTMACSFDKSA